MYRFKTFQFPLFLILAVFSITSSIAGTMIPVYELLLLSDSDDEQKIFIIGDSTVHRHLTDYMRNTLEMTCGQDNPSGTQQGWGDALHIYMKHPENSINKARQGSSSVDFQEPGTEVLGVDRNWQSTAALLQDAGGGILLIQFGSGNENHHAPVADYDDDGDVDNDDETLRRVLRESNFKNALKFYIDSARALNATPILVTPPEGRLDEADAPADGSHPDTRQPFPDYIKAIGLSNGVEVLDLQKKTNGEFSKYSDAKLLAEFGDCSYNTGYVDRVHYEPHGAMKVAGWVKELACEKLVNKSLCAQFKTTEDKVIPDISLNGDYYLVLVPGEIFIDAGATAHDDSDGDISSNIVVAGSVNSNVAGEYNITYDVSDSAGNNAIQVTRVVKITSAVIVREDAEDSDTENWELYATTAGSSITNVIDTDRGGRVIELKGDNGTDNGFRYNRDWNETNSFFISWSMKYSEDFTFFVTATTRNGVRTYEYQPTANPGELTGSGRYRFGLGVDADDGNWHTYTRDLKADLYALDPDNELQIIHRIAIRGSGRIDDIKSMFTATSVGNEVPPVVTLNGSSTVTIARNTVYLDSGATANDDKDGDITAKITADNQVETSVAGRYIVTYKVHDTTGNGAFASRTVFVTGIDEATTVHEDGEDGHTDGWAMYGNTDGSTVNNVNDVERDSRVIVLHGNNGLDNGFNFTGLNITNGFIVSWSLKYSETFRFFVKVRTSAHDPLYIYYTPDDLDRGYEFADNKHYIHNGIGQAAMSGNWMNYSRDIEADLKRVFPDETLQEITGFYIRGSGSIDDISTASRGSHAVFSHNGHTYEIVKTARSWQQASDAAHAGGGYLVNISNIAENHEIYSRLFRYIEDNEYVVTVASNGGGASYVWIGANDLAAENTWIWENSNMPFWNGTMAGFPVGELYSNWGRDTGQTRHEPDDAGGQDAAAMAINEWQINQGNLGQTSQWNDLIATDPLYSIIEYGNLHKPVYEDVADIPELSANSFGAMGTHPVKVISLVNPGYQDSIVNQKAGEQNDYYTSNEPSVRLKVDLFYPADTDTTRPTIFFISGYQHYHSEQFHALLYFIASHGYSAVFVSYQDMRAEEADHIKNILEQVVANPLFSGKIDTSKVGFMGHSLGGGLLFHLIQQLPAWGNSGRFIFTLAGWEAFHQSTIPYTLPANTNLIVQTYNEEVHDRPNNWDTDPRFSIDYLTSTSIDNSNKTYLYLPGDAQHPSSHATPKTGYNRHGRNQFYYDALQQIGIFRPLQSIMNYSFTIDPIDKEIGLPLSSAAIRSSNGITYYSGDNPYTDLAFRDTPAYDSNLYAFPYTAVTMAGSKIEYSPGEDIVIYLEKMDGNATDWVGIFPAGVTNEWGNEITWLHTGGFTDGNLTFHDDLPAGDYEAAAFFYDSLDKIEAKIAFSIIE